MSTTDQIDALWTKLRRDVDDDSSEQANGRARDKLRDMVAQLREAGTPHSHTPASTSSPTFRIGEAKHFPFVTEKGEYHPERGNLSADAAKNFMDAMKAAAKKPDLSSRDAATDRAAGVVARDWLHKHGKHGVLAEEKALLAPELHAMRAQATFAAREIGAKLGLGPVESSALGYSLERALEKHGFRVLNNQVWNRAEGFFRASAASVAGAAGMSAAMERKMGESLTWLAERGITREAVKDMALKHGGKITALVEVLQHPEAIRRAAFILSHSDSAIHAITKMSSDSELRKSVGTLLEATGQTMSNGPGVVRGVGSAAVAVGAMLQGGSNEEIGRHVTRALLTFAGGAAGAAAGVGVASLATGTLGAMAGARLADALINKYDEITGHTGMAAQERHVTRDEVHASLRTLEHKGVDGVRDVEKMHRAHESDATDGYDRSRKRLDDTFDQFRKDDLNRTVALADATSRDNAESLKRLEQQPGARINLSGVGEVTHQNAVEARQLIDWYTQPNDGFAGDRPTYAPRDGNVGSRDGRARSTDHTGKDSAERAAIPSSASGAVADLVARGEGGYDSVNLGRHGGYRAATIQLGNMTVAEVLRAQRNGEFNAAGRYQMIGSTLEGAVHALHLTGNEKFNKGTQDHIFNQYLIREKRSAIGDFIEGRSNDLQGAVRAMSREWASVADPATGASAYAGVANNRASISAEEAAKVLKLARAEYSSGQHKAEGTTASNERDLGRQDRTQEREMTYERRAGKPG